MWNPEVLQHNCSFLLDFLIMTEVPEAELGFSQYSFVIPYKIN